MGRIRNILKQCWPLGAVSATMATVAAGVLVGVLLLFGMVFIAKQDGEYVSPMERDCLQPLRDSWSAGDPDWDILDNCEHGDGRWRGIFGPDKVRREWTMWQGRERAWIVAEAVKNTSNVSADQIQEMINAAVGSDVAEIVAS